MVPAGRPESTSWWDVTSAAEETDWVRLPGLVPYATREVAGSSLVQWISAVPPAPGAAASAESTGGVVSGAPGR